MDYIGEKCPVCSDIFTEDDDIVVCPECGTPHHRKCYSLENRCANEELHASGEKWKRRTIKRDRYILCPVCRFPNGEHDEHCSRCGAELRREEGIAAALDTDGARSETESGFGGIPGAEDITNPIKYLGFDPEEDMGGATLREVSDFVGPNTLYYIPIFKRMKDIGSKITFNIACLIFPALYFANRKMWGWAVLAAFLGILFNLPANLLVYISEFPENVGDFIVSNMGIIETIGGIFAFADIAVHVLFCFFANRMYFRFTLNSLKKLKASPGRAEDLQSVGGIKPMNMVTITLIKLGIGMLVISLVYFGFEMATAISDFSTIS